MLRNYYFENQTGMRFIAMSKNNASEARQGLYKCFMVAKNDTLKLLYSKPTTQADINYLMEV